MDGVQIVSTEVITPAELAERFNGQNVYIETGKEGDTGRQYHDQGVTDEQKQQFRNDCPGAVWTGRFWWIPLENGDHVIIPTEDGNYTIITVQM